MTNKEALDILYKGIAPDSKSNDECIKLCKKALEKQIQSQWISVEDKLPEITRKGKWCGESDHVICAIRATTQSGTRYIVKEGCYAEKGYWRVPGSQSNVVAWMPMPEYEEDD